MKQKLHIVLMLALFFCFRANTKAQCTANFTYSVGLNGMVTFTDTSIGTNPGSIYNWFFGDPLSGVYNSTVGVGVTNPNHLYGSNGNYTVTLLVSTMPGTCAITQVITVTTSPCYTPINASFTYTTYNGGATGFTSNSTGTLGLPSYTYDFGDGSFAYTANAYHVYNNNGTFTASLKVVNGGVCRDSVQTPITITNACTITPSFTYNMGLGGQVNFSNTSVGTPTNTYFGWSFGDMTSGSGSVIPHTYPSNGTYTVTHWIVVPGSCTLTLPQVITVTNSPCNGTINANYSYTNLGGGNVTFSSTSTGTTGLATYTWSFGDGNNAYTPNTSNTYLSNGYYNVKLKVFDSGCSDSLITSVPVNATCNLVASFTSANVFNGNFNFTSTSTGTNMSTTYNWNFGDGGSGTGVTAAHNYTANGTYTVIMYATIPTMTPTPPCTSTAVAVVTVTNACAVNASFTYTNYGAGQVGFYSTSTGTAGSPSYTFNFGDGNSNNFPSTMNTYSANGTYTVSLIVSNGVCTNIAQTVITVANACTITPGFTYSIGLNGLVTFTDTSVGSYTNTVYGWNFGDPLSGPLNSGTGTLVSHQYGSNGTYTVYHNIWAAGSCSLTISQVITVTNSPCNAPINANWTYNTLGGGNYNFTSTSTGTTGLATYTWSFGDGNFSNSPNVAHTYMSSSNYNVKLKVVDGGCMDSLITMLPVNITCTTAASFTSSPGANGYYSFTSTSTGTAPGTTYSWNYGNGNTSSWPNGWTTYTANGTYTVWLTVSSPNWTPACVSSYSAAVTVTNAQCPGLNASFTYTDSGAGLLNFISTSTGTTGLTTYSWNYGDNTTGTGQTSSHTYGNGSYHIVSLTADNGGGCTSTYSTYVFVNSIPCVANSNFSLTYSGTPLLWYATPAYPWNVSTATWNWGDGNTSCCNIFTSHTYSAAGLYSVCLTVSSYTNCGPSTTCVNSNVYRSANAEQQAMVTISVVPYAQFVTALNQNPEENAVVGVYPNPNDGNISLKVIGVKGNKAVNVQVLDILGKEVYTETVGQTNNSVDHVLRLAHLANGAYYIKVVTAERTYTAKTIISH